MTSGYDSWRVAGVPVPHKLDDTLSDTIEPRRGAFPWKHIGNNIIVTVAK